MQMRNGTSGQKLFLEKLALIKIFMDRKIVLFDV